MLDIFQWVSQATFSYINKISSLSNFRRFLLFVFSKEDENRAKRRAAIFHFDWEDKRKPSLLLERMTHQPDSISNSGLENKQKPDHRRLNVCCDNLIIGNLSKLYLLPCGTVSVKSIQHIILFDASKLSLMLHFFLLSSSMGQAMLSSFSFTPTKASWYGWKYEK